MPASHPMHTPTPAFERRTQAAAVVVAAAVLVFGVLGQVLGVTTIHILIHLTVAIVGLVLARTLSGARTYLAGVGIVAAMLFALDPDDWPHLVLAVIAVSVGAWANLGRVANDRNIGVGEGTQPRPIR